MDACMKGDMQKVMQLVGQGADPNYQDDEEDTPLMEAAFYGQLAVCKFLCTKGPSNKAPVNKMTINWTDNNGNTALGEARRMGHGAVADYLVSMGAQH